MPDSKLKPKQALLLFRLFLLGGEEPYVLSEMKPRLLERAADRQQLIDEGLLRRESRPAAKDVLVLTDKAWDWLSEHLEHELPPVPKNQARISKLYGELFLAMRAFLARSIGREQTSLAGFVAEDSPTAPCAFQSSPIPDPSPEAVVVAACRRLAGKLPHAAVRVGAIQDSLPYPWKNVNETLLSLARAGKITLHPCDTPLNLTPRERERAPVLSGVARHLITVTPEP
jgi:hypothetical protein